MQKINHAEALERFEIARKYNINLCLVSPIGEGKTTIAERYVANSNRTLHVLILSALEASESLGVPIRKDIEVNGQMTTVLGTAIPEWAVKAASEPNPVIFIDEVLTASPEVVNPFLNFFTTMKIGHLDLSHAQIILATNVEEDGIGYKLAPNALDRICFFELASTPDETSEYLNKSLGGHQLRSGLMNPVQNFGKGSQLYEPRRLSSRNFEKLAKMSMSEDDIVYLTEFHEGMTNTPLNLESMVRVDFQFFMKEDGRSLDANLKSSKTRMIADQALTNLLGNFTQDMPEDGASIQRAIKNHLTRVLPKITLTQECLNHIQGEMESVMSSLRNNLAG